MALDLPMMGRFTVLTDRSNRRYAMHTFKVEKMSCGGCAARVTRAVQSMDPEAKVEVLLNDGLVQVDSAETADAIAKAVTAAGYPASQAART